MDSKLNCFVALKQCTQLENIIQRYNCNVFFCQDNTDHTENRLVLSTQGGISGGFFDSFESL